MASQWDKEKHLSQECEQYQNLAELFPRAICVQLNNNIIFINNAGAKLFNTINSEKLIGKSVIDFISPRYRKTARERFRSAI